MTRVALLAFACPAFAADYMPRLHKGDFVRSPDNVVGHDNDAGLQSDIAECFQGANASCGRCCAHCTEYQGLESVLSSFPDCGSRDQPESCILMPDGYMENIVIDLRRGVGRDGRCVCYASDLELKDVHFGLTAYGDCLSVRGHELAIHGRGGDDVLIVRDPRAGTPPDPSLDFCAKMRHHDPNSLNLIRGGAGDDYIVAEGSQSWVHGDAGDDYIDVTGDINRVFGDIGDDDIHVHGSANDCWGGHGIDHLTATGGPVRSFAEPDVATSGHGIEWRGPNHLQGGHKEEMELEFPYLGPDKYIPGHPIESFCSTHEKEVKSWSCNTVQWRATTEDTCNDGVCMDTRCCRAQPDAAVSRMVPRVICDATCSNLTKGQWLLLPEGAAGLHEKTPIWPFADRDPVTGGLGDLRFLDTCPWLERFNPYLEDFEDLPQGHPTDDDMEQLQTWNGVAFDNSEFYDI